MSWWKKLIGLADPEPQVFPSSPADVAARIRLVLPTGPSDRDAPVLRPPPIVAEESPPWPGLDDILDLRFPPGCGRSAAEVAVAIHALVPSAGVLTLGPDGWRPARASSTPVEALIVAFRVFRVAEGKQHAPDQAFLVSARRSVASVARRLGAESAPRAGLDDLAARQEALREAWKSAQCSASIVVAAPAARPFEGRLVFDTLHSAGILWGDGDWFHWQPEGHEPLITVSTSAPPGYFFPEDAAAGRLRVPDLVFSTPTVAACPSPGAVYGELLRAARYAARRLGGRVVGVDGEPLDDTFDLRTLEACADRLTALGLVPGGQGALSLVA